MMSKKLQDCIDKNQELIKRIRKTRSQNRLLMHYLNEHKLMVHYVKWALKQKEAKKVNDDEI